MDSAYSGKFLGVLGGMGPMAGAAFMARLTALTQAESEQQHIPAILWSDPRVPDRPSGYLGNGPDPLPWMQNGLRHLEQAGAQAIVVPCNTAHLWYEQFAATVSVPVLHIVQAVIDDLRRNGIHRGRIGLLGTAVTLKLELYQRMLQANGYECVTLTDDELASHCTTAILQVKANRLADAYSPAQRCIDLLGQQGVDAIVLGCTELPLAVPHEVRQSLGVVITDSIDALALAAIDWHAG
ncbi:MAG TPA: amino acid racemase [Candidimonas sp.]|nr:amino acid racemase [Candidimonas sp.]